MNEVRKEMKEVRERKNHCRGILLTIDISLWHYFLFFFLLPSKGDQEKGRHSFEPKPRPCLFHAH